MRRLHVAVFLLVVLAIFSPSFLTFLGYSSSSQTLYAHAEIITIGGNSYYLLKSSPADGPATTLNESAVSTGRKLMGRWVYPLTGIASIEASAWKVTYRAMKSASSKNVVAHCDINILIRKADGAVRDDIASDVANSPSISLINEWETLTGTYDWTAYTVVDQTDYLEIAFYIEVTVAQQSKKVYLRVDDDMLVLEDQTKIQNIMFAFLPVNTPPSISGLPDLELDEDTSLDNAIDLWNYASDAETPVEGLFFTILSVTNPDVGVAIDSNRYIDVQPTANWYGTSEVIVQVSDGELTDTDSFNITVNPVNDPPVAYDQSVTTDEDTPISITLTAYDVDDDTLTYSVVTPPSHGTLSGTAPNLIYTPDSDYFGPDSFTFKANDGQLDSNIATVSITVNPVNDPPVVSDIPDVTFLEDGSDSSIDLDDYVSDVDNTDAEMTWTFTGNVNIIVSIDPITHVVTFTAPANWFGQETITFRATDPGGLWDEDATTVTVTSVNDPPVASDLAISPPSPVTTDYLVGSYTYYDLEGDPESGTEIRWYKNGALQSTYNDLTTIPSSATKKGEAWYFTVRPKDGTDFGDIQTSPTVTIQNSPPVLDPIGDKTVDEETELSFTATATDPDGDPLTFSLGAGAPAGATITSGGAFSWTPTEAQGPGVYTVRIIVSDGIAEDYEDITVTVNEVNVAPIASFTYSPSDPFLYDIITFNASNSNDPDGYIASYTWDFGDGNVITVTDPIITHVYTGGNSSSPTIYNFTVTLTVTDNEGLTNSTTDTVTVINPTILHVSLPAGAYVGPDPDHWLSQCWLLNITELSGTFTIRTNNTHASFASYDTHLIIALNNASYEYLDSLIVDTTTISKASFIYGTPEPYGFALTWEEDVYPTWFSDIYVVGIIDPKSYKDVTVSVTFSNTTGVRMHFDAYGSTDSPPPPAGKGRVTHNPHQKDSTVLFWPPLVVRYYLTVGTDPENIVTILGEGWYDDCTDVELTAPLYVPDEAGVDGERYTFTHWTVDGDLEAGNPITVHMDTNHTAIAHYVKQHYLTVISPYGTPSGMGWYNSSDTAYAMLDTGVVDHGNGTRRVFTHWSGDASGTNYAQSDPIVMDAPKTAIANWKTEHQLTVRISGLGTYVTEVYNGATVLGTATDATPYIGWFEENSIILLNVTSPITDGSRRFVFTHWSGDATGTVRPISVSMSTAKDITAHYKTQYQITVTASPGGALGGTFKVTYTQCGTTYTNVQKTTPWTEWVDASTTVTVSEPQDIINVSPDMRYKFDYYTPSASVIMDQARTITLVYKTQYYLAVRVDPPGVTTIPGEGWYDDCTNAELTAPTVEGYDFRYWDVDGVSQGEGVKTITVPMHAPHTATAHYELIPPLSVSISPTTAEIKIGESVTFTSTVSGGKPPYSYQWYLNGSAVTDAISSTWTFEPTSTGHYAVYLMVIDNLTNTAKSNEATVTVAPKLTVSISPTSASIYVGESVSFTSTVSGGYTPYTYQWYLNDNPVSDATSSSWTFTPTASGIYYVYLKVTDAKGNTAQSDTARITVTAVPVGGYTVSLTKPVAKAPLICYMLLAIFGIVISLIRRKRK